MEIPYPTAPREAIDTNPQLLVLYGQHKVGKTECVAKLPGCLTLVLRAHSADHLSGNLMDIGTLCEAGAFGKFPADNQTAREQHICAAYLSTLEDLYQRRTAGKPVADIIAHDDIGIVEDWVFDLALSNFLATPMGKSKLGEGLRRITDLPGQGGSPGWAYVWEEFNRMMWRIRRASSKAIVIAHMRDKVVNKETGEVSDTDLDLSGKMRKILLREASATGFLFRDREANLVASFRSATNTNVGAWCRHLVGRDVILGRLDANRVTQYDWTTIYPTQK